VIRARVLRALTFGCVMGVLLAGSSAQAQPSSLLFEAGPVRPVTLSPDGTRLFVANIPDSRLEIFDVDPAGALSFHASVMVGLEPVAVAARSNTEVWVVNHLSDSVSIVDVGGAVPFVTRTLLVGDEPRDIVFAGTGGNRAFITTAHRGQHRSHASIAAVPGAGDPQLSTEGIGRADVWVFDATTLGSALGGTPIEILSFFADTPRALATDGTTVYVAAFHSGNQTTVIHETTVCNGFDTSTGCMVDGSMAPGGVPGPDDTSGGSPAPETGLIVKFDGAAWRDVAGRDWSPFVRFSLPDTDVFALDANTLAAGASFAHVGTILFNMVVNPVSGKLYVTNTESPNQVRFEGPGTHGGTTVQGHLAETRISVLDPVGASVDVQHLNSHIDYDLLQANVPAGTKDHSLSTPLQVVVSADGSTAYVAAFGSGKIGVFDTADLEDPNFETNFDPTVESAGYITTGNGPAGLALNEAADRLYVLTRWNNALVSVNLTTKAIVQDLSLHNPEPESVVDGRPFLYDATTTSENGEASCASCHVFGDVDSLAWNLGNPDGSVGTNNQSAVIGTPTPFHPMKGPMATQTLRGLSNHGAMHWRGDRMDGFFGTDDCDDVTGSACDEELSFNNFITAFVDLLGRNGVISGADMQRFTDFGLQLMLPPNPIRALDNILDAVEFNGALNYLANGSDQGLLSCIACHAIDPAQGFFGAQGQESFDSEPQNFKIPQLRNAYQKVGMFGLSTSGGVNLGPQVRGFGFNHDGSFDTLRSFLAQSNFTLTPAQEQNLEAFIFAFTTDLAPIVGQQTTIDPGSYTDTDVNARITLLDARAGTAFTSLVLGGAVTECDLIAKTVEGGVAKGYLRTGTGLYFPDDGGGAISEAALRAKADPAGAGQTITYTCAPPGSGARMGVDRDEDFLGDGVETNTGTFVSATDTGSDPSLADTDGDGFGDGIEVFSGADPNDPNSIPGATIPMMPIIAFVLLALALAYTGYRARKKLDSLDE
jgi:DNA-binding beta-propeller fold protein YncE